MDVKNRGLLPSLAGYGERIKKTVCDSGFLIYPAKFAAAYFLARGIILGSSAPFGIAAGAVCASRRGAVFGMLGAALGYLSVLDRVNSLKYIACLILMYTAHFIFSGTEFTKKRMFAPFSVLVPMLCINGVFLAVSASPLFDAILYIFETALSVLCTYLFSFISDTRKNTGATQTEFSAGLLAATAVAAVSLASLPRVFGISAGSVFALTASLLISFSGGIYAGVLGGTVLGASVSLSLSVPALCPAFSAIGLVCSLLSKKGKFIAVSSAVISAFLTALCLDASLIASFGAELSSSLILFFAISPLFSKISKFIFAKPTKNRENHIRKLTSSKLSALSGAFLAIGNSLNSSSPPSEKAELDIPYAFERAASSACKKCTLSRICWERDFEKTKDALNNATSAVISNGRLSASDFPTYFSSRCIHIGSFTDCVNREIYAMKYRAQFFGKLRESRDLLSRQYTDTSAIFSSLAKEVFEDTKFDENTESEISRFLSSRGILCETAVYRDSEGHMNIHLCGNDLTPFANGETPLCPEISELCGRKLLAPQYTRGEQIDDVIIREAPRFSTRFGSAVRRKNSDGVSGDSGSFMTPSNGKLAVILSDGMGSGREAAQISASNTKLLEGLLRTGMSPKNAISTLQSALMLKIEDTSSFATLDLMYADLFRGKCDFYKLGGAPTYVKRGKKICRITTSSLPAGISIGAKVSPDVSQISILDGDCVVMVSDGVSDPQSDKWLLSFLSETNSCAPKELAEKVIEQAVAVHGKNDDMTVAVICFSEDV